MNELATRLDYLLDRLRTSYDGIGHSSGRPFVYFVYPPERERVMRRLVDDHLTDGAGLHYHHVDLLPLTIQSLAGQEARREELLDDPVRGASAAESIVGIWARQLVRHIGNLLDSPASEERPVIVLRGLAALHPLGNPTRLMERMAEQEPRDQATGRMVPIVILVPGIRPPQTSRTYLFLGLEREELNFYRGEES
jgi:hypothetical protein